MKTLLQRIIQLISHTQLGSADKQAIRAHAAFCVPLIQKIIYIHIWH